MVISNELIPWLIVAVLVVILILPKTNGGKTDLFSRFCGLLGIKVKKDIEDVERETGLVKDDGFDSDLYSYRIRRLNTKLNPQTEATDEVAIVKNAKK
jgi:hypothetical protein